jgi:APA family basic amino acid/polyamine antiporter
MQIIIVIVVVFAGVFEVDVANWSPFMPNGFKAVVTGSTVVFFAYVGFDAVANSAEEAKRPQVISIFFPYSHLCVSFLSS